MREQSTISWELVRLGLWTRVWSGIQTKYARERRISDEGPRWAARAQLAMWEYVSDIWKYRNKIVHGKTPTEQATVRQRKMTAKIDAALANPPK